MAQAVHRLGGEVTLVSGAWNLLVHETRPLGEALAQVLREEGIELFLGATAAAPREGDVYILELGDGNKLSGDRSLGRHRPSASAVTTGRRPSHREPRPREGWRGG